VLLCVCVCGAEAPPQSSVFTEKRSISPLRSDTPTSPQVELEFLFSSSPLFSDERSEVSRSARRLGARKRKRRRRTAVFSRWRWAGGAALHFLFDAEETINIDLHAAFQNKTPGREDGGSVHRDLRPPSLTRGRVT